MTENRVRVVYSFPNRLGGARLSDASWHQVNALAEAGVDVLAFPAGLRKPVASQINVRPTMDWGRLRLPYRLLGKMRALGIHDQIVARRLHKLVGTVDVVHTYAVGSLETLKTARSLGIPTLLERSNAHTRFAFEQVNREAKRLGITLPPTDEYFYREDLLQREEAEYEAAKYILCPSDFVVKTFIEQGVPPEKLLRHFNGVDETVFYPAATPRPSDGRFTMLFAGVCAVRKGVHFALEAWLNSPASRHGSFLIVGTALPAYMEKLSGMLAHPSVKVLGHVPDLPGLMRTCDALVLPSIEEGFGLVVTEAMASGCVPLVSQACTEICEHMKSGLRHSIGDVGALTEHITRLYDEPALLAELRAGGLKIVPEVTWSAVGVKVFEVYRRVVAKSRADAVPKAEAVNALVQGCRAVTALQTTTLPKTHPTDAVGV